MRPLPSSRLPDSATVLRLDIDALTSRPQRKTSTSMVGLLVGAAGSGVVSRIILDGPVAPDYVVLRYGEGRDSERVWARSRQLFNTVEYHLTDDTTAGFPAHTRDVR